MPDFEPAYSDFVSRQDFERYYPNAKSSTIVYGAPVVLTTKSTLTTASNPVVRTLLAADIAAFYKEGTPVAGILGFSLADAVTDSSGVAGIQPAISGKAAAAEPILPIPTYGFGIPVDPNILYTELPVAVAIPGMVFRGKLKTGAATNLSLGPAGIDLTSSVFTVDPSATTKILTVVGWDQLGPIGSTVNTVYFEVMPAYCQYLTSVVYSTQ